MYRLLTLISFVAGLSTLASNVEAATVNVPVKCDANIEFYADVGDTVNFQWIDPSTGVKWAGSQCSDDGSVRQDTIYNQTDSDSTTSYCQPNTLTGFLESATNELGCWWRYYRYQATPSAQFDRDNVPAVLKNTNQGGAALSAGMVVAEQWIDFSEITQNSFHYDIIWKGPTANRPAIVANIAAPAAVPVAVPTPSVPVPTLPAFLLFALSGLLALFGVFRVRASK